MPNLDERIASNIIEFMKRVELKGDEAFAYCEAVDALKNITIEGASDGSVQHSNSPE